MRKRAEIRTTMKPRYWHILLSAIAGAGIFGVTDFAYIRWSGELPSLRGIWFMAVIVPLLCGAVVTLGAGGASLWKRVIGGVVCGGAIGVLYALMPAILGYGAPIGAGDVLVNGVWRVFVFTIMSTIGVLLTEIKLPEPRTK